MIMERKEYWKPKEKEKKIEEKFERQKKGETNNWRRERLHNGLKEKNKNKPDQATMRPDCVYACIDFGARLGRTDRW